MFLHSIHSTCAIIFIGLESILHLQKIKVFASVQVVKIPYMVRLFFLPCLINNFFAKRKKNKVFACQLVSLIHGDRWHYETMQCKTCQSIKTKIVLSKQSMNYIGMPQCIARLSCRYTHCGLGLSMRKKRTCQNKEVDKSYFQVVSSVIRA